MGIVLGMSMFAFWVFSTQRHDAVIFTKFELACVHDRPLNYLDALFLHGAHVPCTCACIMHARHDVIRLTNNANQVIMTSSLVFALYEHHVIMVQLASA